MTAPDIDAVLDGIFGDGFDERRVLIDEALRTLKAERDALQDRAEKAEAAQGGTAAMLEGAYRALVKSQATEAVLRKALEDALKLYESYVPKDGNGKPMFSCYAEARALERCQAALATPAVERVMGVVEAAVAWDGPGLRSELSTKLAVAIERYRSGDE